MGKPELNRVAALWQLFGACGGLWKLQAELSNQTLVRRGFLCLARPQSGAFGKTKGSGVVPERWPSCAFDAAARSNRLLAVQNGEAVNYAAA